MAIRRLRLARRRTIRRLKRGWLSSHFRMAPNRAELPRVNPEHGAWRAPRVEDTLMPAARSLGRRPARDESVWVFWQVGVRGMAEVDEPAGELEVDVLGADDPLRRKGRSRMG